MLSRCINRVLVHVVSHRKTLCRADARERRREPGGRQSVSVCVSVARSGDGRRRRRRRRRRPRVRRFGSYPVVVIAAALSLSSPLQTLLLVITESSPLRCLQRYRSYIILIILYMHIVFSAVMCVCVCVFFFVHHSTRALPDLRYAHKLVNNIIVYIIIYTHRNVDQTTEFSGTSTLRVLHYDGHHHLRSTCLVSRRSDGRLRV